jgi:hypothetical protein
MTRDVDVVCRMDPENLQRIRAERAMGRPRDLHAVLEREAIRERLRE